MPNNSQGKEQQVEDHHRNSKFSNKMSKTTCNDSLNAKSLNINFVCVTCGKCVLNENHNMCVLHYINGVTSRTKMPMAVPISTREPKRIMNQSVATSLKRTVASESTNQKPRSKIKKQYEQISKTCKWWYSKITPPGYKWKPKTSTVNVKPNVSMPLGNKSRTTTISKPMTLRKSTISNTPSSSNFLQLIEKILFIINSGCSKHMTRNLKLLSNFVDNFLGTVKFGNHQITPILGYGDLVQGNITIKRVYYIKGLNHNLFSGGSCGSDIYSITLQDTTTPNPICLMTIATSSQAWVWHCHLSHLNFDSINLLSKNDIVIGLPKFIFVKDHLYSSCELRKAKCKSFHTKTTMSSKRRLQLLHMDLCGPMRAESINGKNMFSLVQRGLHAQVRTIQTDKGTESLSKPLHAYFAQERNKHQTKTARTPKQNGVVERRNRTLVVAARTMLSAIKFPLFF
nr:hypothetical protein [Tanacetum cinerariifolium]